MKKSHQFSLSVVALCIVQIGLQSRSLSIFDISVTKYDQTGLTNSQGGSSLGTRENRGGDVGSREITGIPRTVYMFWENGWHRAKREAVLSYLTWRDMNPGFRVMPLNGSQMELLSNRKMYIPDNVWQNTTVQGRSDVYRTLMVYKYGGIWADASLFCNVPVEEWLDLSADDLISFVRRNNLRQQSLYQIDPWITSWFLAAPKKSYVISKIFHVITDPKEFYRFSRRNAHAAEYFWWHKIVSDIASTDDHVRHRITHDFDYSDPNQCSGKNWTAYAKVLKRCSSNEIAHVHHGSRICACGNHTADMPSVCQVFDCTNITTYAQDVCIDWDCGSYTNNFGLLQKLLALLKRKSKDAFGSPMYSSKLLFKSN